MASLPTKFTFLDLFFDDSLKPLSFDDDDFIFPMFEKENRMCITGYTENVVPNYSFDEFRSHFRLTRSSFELLLNMIMAKSPLVPNIQHGRPSVPAEKQLLLGLWFLATSECCRILCDRFDVSKSSVKRITRKVSEALNDLKHQMIIWPVGGKIIETADKFKAIVGFPGVIGSVDGTHIMIPRPSDHSGAYLNRKKSYSIVLQGVCDADLCFTDVYVGWPGSVHDARVYQNSSLASRMQNMPNEYHLLGDGAYPLSGSLLTPFRDFGNLTRDEKTYNWKHSATRTTVERAFGLLKGI
ncbi:hypothetical protein FSP39_002583 [Pinctada imbricata]|uniref:DDE Tnp4 domain-containing protein n=1 Tax=Pinctada imbricata TaxID=66713 RepID=A0AA88YAY7_PINIB|nr:hypothetical protein FSP39_002583 [Pinctada imbricata]